LRGIRTHGGVLIFDIRIDASGNVTDVRLAKAVDQEPPWPTLAERWLQAISDWRFEPPTLDHKPVAVCLTVTVRQEVM
jgi:TonB family protein